MKSYSNGEILLACKFWRTPSWNLSQVKYIHHVHEEKSNKMQKYIKILLFHIYMKLNMF